jgi:ATP/maltotriose-dependent transcriptional regulator MalT/DNA-binding SARP family transcriptional activator
MTKGTPHRTRQRSPNRPSNPSTRRTARRPQPTHPHGPATWKFEAPALPERLLPREWLTHKLEHHLGGDRVRGAAFVLAAPPGYGKTTVLAQWARQTTIPVTWYHLDATDDDPVVFVRGLIRALSRGLPRATWRVQEILDHLPTGVLGLAELDRVRVTLLDDLRRLLASPVALVLTNVSALGVGRGAHTLLGALLTQQPESLRLVLESRQKPGLPLSPLYMEHRLEGIGQDELSLRDEDFAALLALHDVTLSSDETERLRRLSAGWITGVLLATDAGAPGFLAQQHLTDLNQQAVFDYLAAYVLDALPADLLSFAMQVAVLQTITPELANRLIEGENARERLGELERRTGFLTRVGVGAGEPVYRFQPLLRQALLARLKREQGAERRRELHERAGQLLDADGRYEQAVRHYAHARRYDRIVALIEARRGALLRAGRGATLAKWVAMLPPDVREAHPHLIVLLAELYRHTGQTQRAWQTIRHAKPMIQAQAEPEVAARALTVRAALRHDRAQFARARRDSERALSLAPADADEVRIQATFALASCLMALGRTQEADACLATIEAGALERRDLWALARLYYYRSNLALRDARYADTKRDAQRALLYSQEAHDEIDAINSRINLALIHSCRGEFAAARDDLETAADQTRRAGYVQGRVYVLIGQGDLERMQGHYEAAAGIYQRALEIAERRGQLNARDCALSWLGLTLAIAGQTDDAIALLSPATSAEAPKTNSSGNILLSLGITHYLARDFSRALEILERAREQAVQEESIIRVVRTDVFVAASYLAQERLTEARAILRQALQAVSTEDAVPVLLPNIRLASELRPLLEWMDDPRARALARTLRERGEAPVEVSGRRARADAQGDPTGAIRVYTFGGARVFNGNDPAEHWRLPAARELLCYMLDRGEPARKETLLQAIWSDKDDDLANLNFRQAVFQLKRVLGRPCLKKSQGKWVLAVDCWVDTSDFVRLADEGERLAEMGALAEAATALRQALTYYTGPYLEDVYNDWARVRREQLYLRRQAVLERLAGIEERLGRFEDAARHFYELLEDPAVRESAYCGLMRYYERRGEYGRVRELYERLVRDLGADIAPAAETTALYHRLMADARSGARRAPVGE